MFKKYFLKYSFFLLLLIVTDQLIGTVISRLAQKQIRDNRIGLLLDQKIQPEIAIIGSSRALNNYDPQIIGDSLHRSCYNFGLSGSNILYHETIVDLIIANSKKTSTIIYSIDDHATFFTVTNMLYRQDALFPFAYNNQVNEILCKQLDKQVFATMFSRTYRENINLPNALKYPVYGRETADYKTNHLDSLGANLLVERPEDKPAVFRPYDLKPGEMHINLEYWSAFRRIQEKCAAANIRLIFVLPPIYTIGYPGFRAIVNATVINNSPVYDYTTEFKDGSLFFNPDHLNIAGATVFSQLLVNDIIKSGK